MHTSSFFKKSISLFTTAIFAFSLVLTSSAAAVRSGTQTVEFVPTSKADYVKSVAEAEGISEAEVLYRLESKKESFLAEYGVDDGGVAPANFVPISSEYLGSGVTVQYGFVNLTDTQYGTFDIQCSCSVAIAFHHYGSSFYDVSSTAEVNAVSSGNWTYVDAGSMVVADNVNLTIGYNGIIEVDYDLAVSLGITDFFEFSVGTTEHMRSAVTGSCNYSCPQSS